MDDDPEHDIAIADARGHAHPSHCLLRGAIQAVLIRHQVRRAVISLAVVDDGVISGLNGSYLRREGPTDVLAFDFGVAPGAHNRNIRDVEEVEGEIIVSFETAQREASRRGHDCDAELVLYAVHGVLHLLGYGDDSEEDAAIMHELEDDVLESISLGRVFRDGEK